MEGQPLRVLFAEDNIAHATLVLRSLEEHGLGVEITHVKDGEEALDFLLRRKAFADPESSPRPDLVLLDLRMPKIDGLEVLRQIKTNQELHRLPVVILTTSEAESDVARAYDLRANSYLVKPIDFTKFSDLMHDLGLYWSMWNRSPHLTQAS